MRLTVARPFDLRIRRPDGTFATMKPGESPYAGFHDRPIFIGACPRSGTTLLRSMLNSHPEIGIPRETKFITTLWEARAQWQDLASPTARDRLAAAVGEFNATGADRFGVPKDELLKRLVAAPPTLGSVVGTCFKTYAETTGKPRWGDKRPLYARYLDMIFTLFPDAQYVHLTRDPRAAVDSIRRLGWYGGKVPSALDLWVRSVRAVEPWRPHLHHDQILDVRYEDLVADPEPVLARLAQFLRVSAQAIPAMLDYRSHVDATAKRYHRRLTEPLDAGRINAWTSSLDAGEIALVEHVTDDLMEEFGYDRVAGSKPPAEALRGYRSIRRRSALARRRLETLEVRRDLSLHRPLGARLTSGQRGVDSGPQLPPFWQRHIGKV
jgi:Sulfotransferase family